MTSPFKLTAARGRPEEALQRQVAAMLRAYMPSEAWWCASLSGAPLTPAARSAAKACGLERGAPDLSFILPDGVTVYIELKAPDGVLTTEQKRVAGLLGARRFTVARSWSEVRAIISAWLEPYGLRLLTDGESVRRALRT